MTSARDILYDVFLPALKEKRFATGLFLLCRYSFLPYARGMMAVGIRGSLHPFATGDCREYRTWHRADVGIKDEQTAMSAPVHQMFRALRAPVKGRSFVEAVDKRNGVFYLGSQKERISD